MDAHQNIIGLTLAHAHTYSLSHFLHLPHIHAHRRDDSGGKQLDMYSIGLSFSLSHFLSHIHTHTHTHTHMHGRDISSDQGLGI